MIVSASRRTDIPCYYAEWFMNRVRAGYALTRNPMNHAQLKRVELTPDAADMIVFWTKHARNIMPYLDELSARGFEYCFQHTLTPYGAQIEPNLRPKSEIVSDFIALSRRVGAQRVIWRYDPIILNDDMDAEYHARNFKRLADALCKYTDTVTISFVDMYSKLKSPLVREISDTEMARLAEIIGKAARERGLSAQACCEKMDLSAYGIARAKCIDGARIERILGRRLTLKPDKNQRAGCGCAQSVDIGAYNTCLNGCVYCYANDGGARAKRRYANHDPEGELITGEATD